MNTNTVRFGMAAAAVVVLAIIGWRFLPASNTGAGPNATPTPTPTPTPPASLSILPTSGTISPGRYAFDWRDGKVSIEIPAGWTATSHGLGKNVTGGGELGFSPHFPGSAFEVTVVYADACRSAGALESIGPTVDDLVAALDDQVATDAVITDMELDGRPVKRVELAPTEGLDRSECRHGEEGPLQIWADPNENNFFALGQDYYGIVWVVDVDGDRVVFSAAIEANAPEADVAELEAMVASMEFAQ